MRRYPVSYCGICFKRLSFNAVCVHTIPHTKECMNYIDKYGRYHDKPVTEDKPIGDKSKELPAPKYFIKGKLNGRIINEQVLLTDTAKLTLTKILVRQVLKKKWTPSTCDQPRHSIIVYKNNKQSYIDICFGCRRVHTSKDIDFSEFYMDEKKWEQLKNFFKNNGLTQVFNEYNE